MFSADEPLRSLRMTTQESRYNLLELTIDKSTALGMNFVNSISETIADFSEINVNLLIQSAQARLHRRKTNSYVGNFQFKLQRFPS